MNQNEKKQVSYNKILNAAILEFGANFYETASLNNICKSNNISKGLIYHYFKNKDALFLSCVKLCFDKLIEHLDKQCTLSDYFNLRQQFFCENEIYSNIFFNTVINPPSHLIEEIKKLRKKFDELNMNHYRSALKNITLRDDITEDEAVEYFYIFQEMFNSYFKSKVYENENFNLLIKQHEVNISKAMNIILYGIAERGNTK